MQTLLHYDFTREPFCSRVLDLSGRFGNKNLVTNSSFDTDISGWRFWTRKNNTLTRDTSEYHSAPASARIDASEATVISDCNLYILDDNHHRNIYRVSFWVKATSATTIRCRLQRNSGSYETVSNVEFFNVSAGWRYISCELIATVAGSVRISFEPQLSVGNSLYVDDVLVTTFPDKRAVLHGGVQWTPQGLMFNGSDGYLSIEDNVDADVTEISESKPLTIGIVFNPSFVGAMLFDKDLAGSNGQYALCIGGTGYLTAVLEGNSYNLFYAKAEENNFILLSYDGTNLKAYLDGELKKIVSAPVVTLTSRPNFRIGCRPSNNAGTTHTAFYKGVISEFFICNEKPDDVLNWFVGRNKIYPTQQMADARFAFSAGVNSVVNNIQVMEVENNANNAEQLSI